MHLFFIYVRFFNKVWMSWLIRGWMWNSVAVCDVLRVVARYYRGGFSSQCHSFLLLGIRVTKGREGEKGDFRLLWQVWILLKRTSVKKKKRSRRRVDCTRWADKRCPPFSESFNGVFKRAQKNHAERLQCSITLTAFTQQTVFRSHWGLKVGW